MYEGIPTKKKAPNEKSWAPKHKAVFGEEPRMVHESVFGKVGEDGKEKPASDKELTDAAKVIRGNAPSAIHEKVFGKEERIKAPIHESVFGKDKGETKKEEPVQEEVKEETVQEPEKDRVEGAERERALKMFRDFRTRLESGETIKVRLERLTKERKLDVNSFKNAYADALDMYDKMYLPLAKAFFKDEQEALIPVMEKLRETLKDGKEVRKNYENYLEGMRREHAERQKKAA